MKCPVCAKHVAEERYELHVGRHTDAQLDEAGIPATVGAPTLEDGDGVDASALLLAPENWTPRYRELRKELDDLTKKIDTTRAKPVEPRAKKRPATR